MCLLYCVCVWLVLFLFFCFVISEHNSTYEMHLFCALAKTFCFPAAGLFSRSRLCGTRSVAAHTAVLLCELGRRRNVEMWRVYPSARGFFFLTRKKKGGQPGSVTYALGIQSCASCLFFTGLLSPTPSRPGQWKPLIFFYDRLCYCYCCMAPSSFQLSSSLRTLRQPRRYKSS